MDRLGYPRFGAHGGDVGVFISAQLGHKHADRITGLHLTTPGVLTLMAGNGWREAEYGPKDARHAERMQKVRGSEVGHFVIQSTKPQNHAVAFFWDAPIIRTAPAPGVLHVPTGGRECLALKVLMEAWRRHYIA